jgi:hypothetical protein
MKFAPKMNMEGGRYIYWITKDDGERVTLYADKKLVDTKKKTAKEAIPTTDRRRQHEPNHVAYTRGHMKYHTRRDKQDKNTLYQVASNDTINWCYSFVQTMPDYNQIKHFKVMTYTFGVVDGQDPTTYAICGTGLEPTEDQWNDAMNAERLPPEVTRYIKEV